MLVSSETNTRFRLRGAPIIHDTIDNETIAINQLTGAYYSIEGPGALVWQLLADGATASEIAVCLADSYAGDRDAIEAAVSAFLEEMTTEELIVHDDGLSHAGNGAAPHGPSAGSPVVGPGEGQRPAFTGLRLQRYNDLEVMLLADPIHEVDATGWPMPLTDARE